MTAAAPPWPTELRVTDRGRTLHLTFDDGRAFDLSAELLRVESPSAEVQGHSAAERRIIAGKRNVALRGVAPVGHYAVRLTFDDGHDTGLFTWTYLRDMGERQDEVWSGYLAALAARGLTRD